MTRSTGGATGGAHGGATVQMQASKSNLSPHQQQRKERMLELKESNARIAAAKSALRAAKREQLTAAVELKPSESSQMDGEHKENCERRIARGRSQTWGGDSSGKIEHSELNPMHQGRKEGREATDNVAHDEVWAAAKHKKWPLHKHTRQVQVSIHDLQLGDGGDGVADSNDTRVNKGS